MKLLEEDSFFSAWAYTAHDTEGVRTLVSDGVLTHNNNKNANNHEF